MVADQREGFSGIAGVDEQLPAAGLAHRDHDLVPQASQQADRGLAHVWEEAVHEARDEQRDPHAIDPTVAQMNK